jgi:hypothetical protein
MQPVWHHFAWMQRFRSIATGTLSHVCPAALRVAAHRPPDFATCFQLGRCTRSAASTRL